MAWLLCDFGNVLAHAPSDEDAYKLLKLSGKTEAELRSSYWAFRLPYDADLTMRGYWSSIVEDPDTVERLVEQDLAGWMRPNDEVIEAVKRAKERGYRLALFSNAPEEFVDAFAAASWLSDFEHIFVSSEVGAKPEADAYLKVCAALGAEPSDITFIDDRPENIEGAAALGINAVLFTEASQIDAL